MIRNKYFNPLNVLVDCVAALFTGDVLKKVSVHKTYFNLVTAVDCPSGSSACTRLKAFSGNMFTRRSFY